MRAVGEPVNTTPSRAWMPGHLAARCGQAVRIMEPAAAEPVQDDADRDGRSCTIAERGDERIAYRSGWKM